MYFYLLSLAMLVEARALHGTVPFAIWTPYPPGRVTAGDRPEHSL